MAAEKQELRGLCPTPILQALDALAVAHGGGDRMSYINAVLEKHVKAEAHRASVLVRMMRGNPLMPDDTGGMSE